MSADGSEYFGSMKGHKESAPAHSSQCLSLSAASRSVEIANIQCLQLLLNFHDVGGMHVLKSRLGDLMRNYACCLQFDNSNQCKSLDNNTKST